MINELGNKIDELGNKINELGKKIKDFFIKREESLVNNIVKAIIIGFTVGLIFGFTGENWDFTVHHYIYKVKYFQYYGTKQALIVGFLTTLSLFLYYNKK